MRTVMAMFVVAMMVALCQPVYSAGGGDNESELRRLKYELSALSDVTKLEVNLYDEDWAFNSSASAEFVGGEARLTSDVKTGPGNYRGYAYWLNAWGDELFIAGDPKLTAFRPGMNMKDFPVDLNWNRIIRLKIDGPSSSDAVWVNGQRAGFSNGFWRVNVNQPWNIDSLLVIWPGHGGWELAVDSAFQFDSVVDLSAGDMDPNNGSISQMTAWSYPAEGSWVDGVATCQGLVYDQVMCIKVSTTLPDGIMFCFLSYQDGYTGNTMEYYNVSVKARGGTILIPLGGDSWFNPEKTAIRLVYINADGEVCQTWVQIAVPTVGEKG